VSALALPLFICAFNLVLVAQDPVEHAQLPLFHTSHHELALVPEGKEFYVQVPHHIRPGAGSVIRLTLRRLSDPPATSNAVVIAWNGRSLATNFSEPVTAEITLQVSIPRRLLPRGVNTLSVRPLPPGDAEPPVREAEPLRWSMRQTECVLDLAYTRPPLTDGLARFPSSLAEEQLLQRSADSPSNHLVAPGITILLPGLCAEIHLRAAAIVSARLGQLPYLDASQCRLAPLESWKAETARHHGVLIGRRDQLSGMVLPPAIASALATLASGQGLLAEFVEGEVPAQRRLVLVTGADATGLEKAAPTLGSAPALAGLASPAVLDPTAALDAGSEPAAKPRPLDRAGPIEGLYQLQEFLKTDRYARHAAFALPAGLSLEAVGELFPVWWELGRALADSPVLWPEVVTYRPGAPPEPARLRERNVLAMGAISRWPDVLPPRAERPALSMISSEAGTVIMQGRRHNRNEFDPSLSFVQMLPSPWSSGYVVVLMGGWRTFVGPATRQLLLNPGTPSQLAGTLGAMDELGRATSYDLRQVTSESFAERLRRTIPPGVAWEESKQRVARQTARLQGSRHRNGQLSLICGSVLGLLVAARLVLMWQQARVRQKALDDEPVQGGPA